MRGVDIGDKRRPVCRLIAEVSKRLNKTGEGDVINYDRLCWPDGEICQTQQS